MMRSKRPFASVMQAILIVLMLLSFVLIAQQVSFTVYQIGLLLLVVSALVQIGFGNIPPESSFGRSMKLLSLILAIVVIVFGVGLLLTPYLIKLGRGG